MSYITMKELLEAGVHFGHQTRRWNPKMKPYIFGARNGIYIIDLQKTVRMFRKVYDFVVDTVSNGKSLLFVGTKKQARDSVYEEANRCEMYYVHNRWLGGMLTNFQTIRKSIERLNYLNTIVNDESINLFPKKERLKLRKERIKLDNNLGGIRTMNGLPGGIFVVDPKNEAIAVREGRRLGELRQVEIHSGPIKVGGRQLLSSIIHDVTKRRQAEEALQHRNRELTLLNQVIAASVATTEPEEFLESVCRELTQAFNLSYVATLYVDPDQQTIKVVAGYAAQKVPPLPGDTFSLDPDSLVQTILTTREPLIVADVKNEPN